MEYIFFYAKFSLVKLKFSFCNPEINLSKVKNFRCQKPRNQ